MEVASKISSYQDLDVWKLSRQLVKAVYEATKNFPREDRYEIVSQMRRAAISIPSNIAEGHARPGRNDFANFISIALGSAAELQTQVILSEDLGYLTQDASNTLLNMIQSIQRMLHRLHQAVTR